MTAAQAGKPGSAPGRLLALALLLWLSACVQDGQLPYLGLSDAKGPSSLAAADAPAQPARLPEASARPSPAASSGVASASAAPPAAEAGGDFSLSALKRRLDAAFSPSGPSIAQRQQLGDALAREVLSRATLANDQPLQRRIEGIVHRLARVAAQDNPWPGRWRVHILRDDRPDAFTSGGGHLFITTGMIDLLERDERIATVLAHEMAHNLLGHVWAAKEKKDMARRAHSFSRAVLAEKMKLPWLGKSVSFVVNASLNTYSRQQEYDADGEGLDLLVRAGWKPQVALETFDYLRRRFRDEGVLKNFFYNNHPLYERRRWYIENRIRAHYRKQAGLPPVRPRNWKTRR